MSNEENWLERADEILAGIKKERQLGEEAKQRNEEIEQEWEAHQLTKAEWDGFSSVYRKLPEQAKFLVNMLGVGAYNGQMEENL